VPESAFQVVAYVRKSIEIGAVQLDGICQALAHGWGKAVRQAADAGARAYLDQPQRFGRFKLLAQARDAYA
jgi:hypothetical protein